MGIDVALLPVMTSRLPQTNARQWVRACHGNLATLHGFIGVHFAVMINIKFISFDAIGLFQSKNTFVLIKTLQYHKHLSASLIAVGDNIVSKSLYNSLGGHFSKSAFTLWQVRIINCIFFLNSHWLF